MGNLSGKFQRPRKSPVPNSILQTPEAKGFLIEICKCLPFDEAVSKLSRAVHYFRHLDDFECQNVHKLISFIRLYTVSPNNANQQNSVQSRLIWIHHLCTEGAMELCMEIWASLFSAKLFLPKYENLARTFRILVDIILNCSDISTESCQALCRSRVVTILLDCLKSSHLTLEILQRDPFNVNRLYTIHSTLSILRNILATCPQAKYTFRTCNGLEICKQYLNCEINIVKCEAFLCLAYAINEHENHVISGGIRNLHFMYAIKILTDCVHESEVSKHYCPTVHLIMAINRLSADEVNKVRLANLGILDLYAIVMRRWRNEEEVVQAAYGVWSLAFNAENREKILGNKQLIDALISLVRARRPELTVAAEGAIWITDERLEREAMRYRMMHIEGKSDEGANGPVASPAPPAPSLSDCLSCREDPTGYAIVPQDRADVLLSYESTQKEQAEQVAGYLRQAGLLVWMDDTGRATLDEKVDAIERAKVMLLCISDSYKTSPACRSVVDYAVLIDRHFVSILMEENYQPDGWLGIQVGKKPLYDMSTANSMADNISQLINYLIHGRSIEPHNDWKMDTEQSALSPIKTAPYRPTNTVHKSKTMDTIRRPAQWTRNDVQTWLEKIGLLEVQEIFAQFDGAALVALQRMLSRAPAIYYCNMKHDFGITDILLLLRFTNALEMLS